MGGVSKASHRSYQHSYKKQVVGNAGTQTKLRKKVVFTSFSMDDEAQVDLLRMQAKSDRFDLEFTDYSVKEAYEEKWKTNCKPRIERSDIELVFIGENTHSREAVIWEIEQAYKMGKKVIGVRIYRDKNYKIPQPLIDHHAKIINWDLKDIQREIDNVN